MAGSGLTLAPSLRSAPNVFITSSGFARLKARNSDLQVLYYLDQRINGAFRIVTDLGNVFRVPHLSSIPFCIG
jgi:hypothetical protein